MNPFNYPSKPHIRVHGPFGYKDYESYRDWLRDEFSFRCVYCLKREPWAPRTATFHIDHVVPQSVNPGNRESYDNLSYVCARCNELKQAVSLPPPDLCDWLNLLQVGNDGSVTGLTPEGRDLVQILDLDSSELRQWRCNFMAIWRLTSSNDRATFLSLFGYPVDLPNLSRKLAKGNTRPKGLLNCCFARRAGGTLPDHF